MCFKVRIAIFRLVIVRKCQNCVLTFFLSTANYNSPFQVLISQFLEKRSKLLEKTLFKHMFVSLNQLLQISSAIIIIIFLYYSVGETKLSQKTLYCVIKFNVLEVILPSLIQKVTETAFSDSKLIL